MRREGGEGEEELEGRTPGPLLRSHGVDAQMHIHMMPDGWLPCITWLRSVSHRETWSCHLDRWIAAPARMHSTIRVR